MQYRVNGTSIVEAVIVLLIVVMGITGVYSLLDSSQKLADSTGKRIEAIQIARDGLEAFTTIRNTNWDLFWADYENCWNTLNYDGNCVWGGWAIIGTWSYIVYQNTDNQFELINITQGWDYSNSDYRTEFAIQKNTQWFYTQSWGDPYGAWGVPFYTREIEVSYSGSEILNINTIVWWNDRAKNDVQKLEMSTSLTNWKSKQ